MSTEFKVTVKATSLQVYPGSEAMDRLETIINLLTYEDEYVEELKTLGFMYDESTDILYLHKGVDLNYIMKFLPNAHVEYDNFHDFKPMNFEYEVVIPPRNDEQVDVINFIAGLSHHSANINERQLFLVKQPGSGKAQPYSTKIPTSNGYKLMGDLKVGDYVLNQMGKPIKVLKMFERGERYVWKITFEDGRTSLCDIEHLWPVFISNKEKYVIMDVHQMIDMREDLRKLCIPTYKKENGNRLEIIDIKPCYYKENMRCILVDDPNHLYLTEDYIVTHNTYCSGAGLCQFGVKTLIIMHRDSLRGQWAKSLFTMNGLSSKYVHEISSSDEISAIVNGDVEYDYDVYLLTHATFRAGFNKVKSMEKMGLLTKNLGIGFKIIDEAHLEFRDTLMMDFCFNVKRNLYLTATDGRSSREENSIFKHVFSHALFYKPSALLSTGIPSRWTEYITVALNSNCNPNIYRYRVAGGRGMNPASYGKWVIQYDKKNTHFKCCRDLLRIIYENDENAKVLVFMPLIDLCSEAAHFFVKELNYDESFKYDLNVKTINSKNTKSENDYNRKADVIVTTIASCGTGTDIPGVTDIISCSPYVSGVTAKQVFGRIRYCGKTCHYYDIFDESVLMDKIWLKSRRKRIKQIALSTRHMVWTEDK